MAVRRIGFYLGGMSGPASGAHSRLVGLIRALHGDGVELFVYGTALQLTDLPELPGVHRRLIASPSRFQRFFFPGRTIQGVVDSDGLDVLQFETVPVSRIKGCDLILSIHHLNRVGGGRLRSLPSRLKNIIKVMVIRRAIRRIQGIVTLTEWSRRDIIERLGIKNCPVIVIPHLVDYPTSTPARNFNRLPATPNRYVLALGHLEERKNLQTLIVAATNPLWPDAVKVVISGRDNGDERKLRQLATARGAPIVFTGAVDESTKQSLLSNALCLVMPSTLEGFGIPVVEAISAGTPALVSDRSALPEVVGVPEAVIPANESAGWAHAVKNLATRDGYRAALLSKEQYQLRRYSSWQIRSRYMSMLDSFLSTGKCDILHLAFGGLGGHRAVVEEISHVLAVTELRSGTLLLAKEGEFSWGSEVTCLAFSHQVPIRHRADFGSMGQVARAIRHLKPSYVLAHSHRHIPAAWLGQRLAHRKPMILVVEHQALTMRTILDNLNSLIGIVFSKGIVFLGDAYQSHYPLRWFVRHLQRPTFVVPNGIQIPSRKKTWPAENGSTRVIGIASRLIPSKRVDLLIEALSILSQSGNWKLRIAGEGPEQSRLESLVRDWRLEEKVIFDGNVDRSYIANWYLSLDCYVQVSEGETMSMSVVEAASFALPIISSRDPGIERIFDANRSIVLLRQNAPEVIAEEIERIFQDQIHESLGIEARECVQKKYGAREMACGYLEAISYVETASPSRVGESLRLLRRIP